MNVLNVQGLCKQYPGFSLKDVSFSLEPGQIVGFIGRNGAGKTTTLKAMLQMIRPDAGSVSFFGLPFEAHQREIKQRIGFVAGGVDYYLGKRLRQICSVTRQFYDNWDDALCQRYMAQFHLDDQKTPKQLSAGMRVKFAMTLALSHHAELLILDEPTSGLDPISRDEVLDILLELVREGVTILFSTHITSDLDRCADRILYLRNGSLAADAPLQDFVNSYRLVRLEDGQAVLPELIGYKRAKSGYTALVRTPSSLCTEAASLDEIMVHLEKEETT